MLSVTTTGKLLLGGPAYWKPGSDPLPLGVLTVMAPLDPLPTAAVITLSLTTVKEAAAVAPKLTAVAPVKPGPFMVIGLPLAPPVGVNPYTSTGGRNLT